MKAQSEDHQFAAFFVDVSDCNDELRFVQRLYTAILEHNSLHERLWKGLQESWLGKTLAPTV